MSLCQIISSKCVSGVKTFQIREEKFEYSQDTPRNNLENVLLVQYFWPYDQTCWRILDGGDGLNFLLSLALICIPDTSFSSPLGFGVKVQMFLLSLGRIVHYSQVTYQRNSADPPPPVAVRCSHL